VHLLNDVTAAGYRYVEPDLQDFCLVTVSSGIGNKVFLRGSPVTGPGGRGGEIGHLRVDLSDNALRCDCGMSGHLGAVASGRGALSLALCLAREAPREFASSSLARACDPDHPAFDTEALAAAFRSGDAWAARVIDRVAAHLGYVLAAIHAAVGIERFILIGGFAFGLGEQYRRRVAEAAATSGWDLGQRWSSMISFGIDDDDSGLLGAGRYAITQRVG
jgi:glucokinase